MECKVQQTKQQCTCTNTTCANHGICCQCVTNHREKGQLPACLREIAAAK